MTDVITLIPILALICILFYFSHREIKKSLEKSREIQELLSQDREKLRHALYEERLKRLYELEKAAEFGRLAQGLFHDLITPLTSIILHTQSIQTEMSTKHIDTAVDASRRMAVYIKDIRSTLQKEENMTPCNMNDELESTLRIFSYKARDRQVEIETEVDTQCKWTAGPTKLRQLFSNLISNALDSFDTISDNRQRTVYIQISQNTLDLPHSLQTIITITDNGSGIAEDVLTKIYEPFFTTKPYDRGTGIGLSTVKDIVEKHLKGSIRITSKLTHGTSVTITYPT